MQAESPSHLTPGRIPARSRRIARLLWAAAGLATPAVAAPPLATAQEAISWILSGGKRAPTLVGDQVCAECHRDIVERFHQTAHARTSSLASAETIHGHFTAGANVLRTVNPDLTFVMETDGRAFTETAHLQTPQGEMTRSERIDLVVGSGRKGQTYLYWDGDRLCELPVSYWTSLDGWVNSPGYADGTANFDRSVIPRCLECHASSFIPRPPAENRYDPASLVLGVDCERCHGPGSEHAARFRSGSPPQAPADFAIVNPARLGRERQMDVCALCHDSSGQSLAPPLSYRAGDDISRDLRFAPLDPNAQVDVHAGQMQLLERSRCFRSSANLTCVTCHDVHRPQRDAASFSSKCMTCHQVRDCGRFPQLGRAIATRCIECHMPLQETAKIVSSVDGSKVQPQVRNHRIAIYPDHVN